MSRSATSAALWPPSVSVRVSMGGRRAPPARARSPTCGPEATACKGTAAMDAWIEQHAAAIAARFERELDPLVGVSSPSGDVRGAEEAAAVAAALAPDAAAVDRLPCAS